VGKVHAALARAVARGASLCAALRDPVRRRDHGHGARPGGRGGRASEFLLGCAIALQGQPGVHVLAADTDGIDGIEDNAGAVVTPDTLARARRGHEGRRAPGPQRRLRLLLALGDLVVTGPTFTNVNDFRALLVPEVFADLSKNLWDLKTRQAADSSWRECGLAARRDAMLARRAHQHHRRPRRAAHRAARAAWQGPFSDEVHGVLDGCSPSPSSVRDTAAASDMWSTSASAAATWARRWWCRRWTPFASKTFTTQETMANARRPRGSGSSTRAAPTSARHFVATTTNLRRRPPSASTPPSASGTGWAGATRCGAPSACRSPSPWAPALPRLLAGAHAMDQHFAEPRWRATCRCCWACWTSGTATSTASPAAAWRPTTRA
jgi:hypothetical protein